MRWHVRTSSRGVTLLNGRGRNAHGRRLTLLPKEARPASAPRLRSRSHLVRQRTGRSDVPWGRCWGRFQAVPPWSWTAPIGATARAAWLSGWAVGLLVHLSEPAVGHRPTTLRDSARVTRSNPSSDRPSDSTKSLPVTANSTSSSSVDLHGAGLRLAAIDVNRS